MAIYADTDTFSGTIQALGGSGYEYGESGTTHLESSLIVGFTADPLSATAPLTVTFTNTTTGDVTGYEWAFGDDSTSVITHPTHVYTTTGVYTVSLTVTGPGISDTLTRTNYITVTSAAGEPVIITRVITYTYDPLNRLTEADYSTPSTGSGQAGEQFEYAYDEMGNRTVMTDVTGVTTYTYDLANRLTSVGDVTYTWDDRGNLVSNGTFTYTYNAAGRMVQAESVTVTLVYTYNVNGLRVAQSVDDNVTSFVWDWASGIPEMLSDGDNLYLVSHETLGQWDSATWAYYLPDALGSIRQTTDDTGAVTDSREWTPSGVEMGTAQAGLGFTGEWLDSYAESIYLRARWYAPGTGRFPTRDSFLGFIGLPQTQNPYVYVTNNSVSLVDPSGRVPQPPPPVPYPYDITAFEVSWLWLTEQCPELLVFNEKYDLTQSLMYDEGVNQARAQFHRKRREGTLDHGTDDVYRHRYLVIPYIREAIQYLTGDDRVGFFLGSYTVRTHLRADGKTVTFTVKDPKNWESAGRNPFYWIPELIMEPYVNPYLPESLQFHPSKNTLEGLIMDPSRFVFPSDIFLAGLLFERRERGDPGFFGSNIRLGGDIDIVFTWEESLKVLEGCPRK